MDNLKEAKKIINNDLPRSYSVDIDKSLIGGISGYTVRMEGVTEIYLDNDEVANILVDHLEKKIKESKK